jgi:hypothetical protein
MGLCLRPSNPRMPIRTPGVCRVRLQYHRLVTVALMGTACGLPVALLGMLRVADSEPSSSANSTTMISQLFPTASEDGQNLSGEKSSRSAPAPGVTETFPIDTALVPVFFSVTVLNSRLNRGTVPNERLEGVTLSCSGAGLTALTRVPNWVNSKQCCSYRFPQEAIAFIGQPFLVCAAARFPECSC